MNRLVENRPVAAVRRDDRHARKRLACLSQHALAWTPLERPSDPLRPRIHRHSGRSPIIPSSGSTCISQAHLEGFAPPAPFTLDELDPAGVLPEQPYTKEELHAYLVQLRKKCQTTMLSLSDEKAHQPVAFPWARGKPVSYFELQLYTMRHVQEHAAQLSLFLGQHAIPDEALDWVPRAKGELGS